MAVTETGQAGARVLDGSEAPAAPSSSGERGAVGLLVLDLQLGLYQWPF